MFARDGRRDEPIRLLLHLLGVTWLHNLDNEEIPGYGQKDYVSNYRLLDPRLNFSEEKTDLKYAPMLVD